MKLDYVIKNGTLVDGTGAPPCSADIGIRDGRIAEIGSILPGEAERVFDAKGRVVSPGFIDVHTHSELSILQRPSAIQKISQGITMEITGHCGESPYPVKHSDGKESFTDLNSYRKAVKENGGMSLDHASLIGHGTLREQVIGAGDGKASQRDIEEMSAMLEEEFRQGACGMSSGLEYAPGIYSDAEEMIPLAAVCKKYESVYTTHMRSEGMKFLEAVEETLSVAKRSGATTVISHIKACGKPNHGKVTEALRRIDAANEAGADVYMDCYPYPAACTGLSIALPAYTKAKGHEEMMRCLTTEDGRAEIRRWFSLGTDVWENRSIVTGWENISVAYLASERNKYCIGKSIREIAAIRGVDELTAYMDLLAEENGEVSAILRSACEEDIVAAYSHPRTMVCSDATSIYGRPHPRLYASHTRFLAHYADLSTDEGLVRAVYRMTGLPARVYRMKDVGILAPGKRANLTVFDPAGVKDNATFEEPCQLSDGIDAVFVGGLLSYRDREVTSVRSGRFYMAQ